MFLEHRCRGDGDIAQIHGDQASTQLGGGKLFVRHIGKRRVAESVGETLGVDVAGELHILLVDPVTQEHFTGEIVLLILGHECGEFRTEVDRHGNGKKQQEKRFHFTVLENNYDCREDDLSKTGFVSKSDWLYRC